MRQNQNQPNVQIVPVSALIIPVSGMLRQFERGKQEKDVQGQPIEGKGDGAYIKFYERKKSMEAELLTSGYANHTAIIVYPGTEGETVETLEGIIETKGKYIVVDGAQRTGTALEMGDETPVKIEVCEKERARDMMVSANYHRKANTPKQFVKILKTDLSDNPNITIDDLCRKYSMAESTINRYLSILTLPVEVKEKIGDSVTVQKSVELADYIQKYAKGQDAEKNKTALVTACLHGDLTEVAEEIEKERKKKIMDARGQKAVYVPPEPIYNAERARMAIAEIENVLQDEPENEYFKGQLDMWQFIHGVSQKDRKSHRENWLKNNK